MYTFNIFTKGGINHELLLIDVVSEREVKNNNREINTHYTHVWNSNLLVDK